jgi:hypothetical protein
MPSLTKKQSQLVEVERVRSVIHRFVVWLNRFGESSQDQYDFWASPLGQWAKALYYRHKILAAPVVTPFVLLDAFIPALRTMASPPRCFPIADAHYAMGFFLLAKADQDIRWVQRGKGFLVELKASRCNEFNHYSWGYPFDWETRIGTIKADTPLITTTPYGYEAFEAGYETTGESEYLEIMKSVGVFVFENFNETEVSPGVFACSYTPIDNRRVVNANAYRAFLLMTAGEQFKRKDWQAAAKRNLAFVLSSQQADGSWLYAMDGKDQFVDNFHTCFVLKNLYKIWQITDEPAVLDAIRRGFEFYKQFLLDQNGQPIPYARAQHLTLYRRELYDYAEGINLALLLKDIDLDAPIILDELIRGLLEYWHLPDGHFVTRQLLLGRNTIPYHRWAQSQTFRALALYCATIG